METYEFWTEQELEEMIEKYQKTLRDAANDDVIDMLTPIYEDMIAALEDKKQRSKHRNW